MEVPKLWEAIQMHLKYELAIESSENSNWGTLRIKYSTGTWSA